MCLIDRLLEKANSKIIVLQETRIISQEDLLEEKWKLIHESYQKKQSATWKEKAAVSLTNAIVHQQRAVFVITREALRELLKNDKNWDKSIGLKDSNYKPLLLTLHKAEMIKKIERGKKSHVYELLAEEVLKMIDADINEQRVESIAFANTEDDILSEGTTKGTERGAQGKREIKSQSKTKTSEVNSVEITSHPPVQERNLDFINIDLSQTSPPEFSDTPKVITYYSNQWAIAFKQEVGDLKKRLFRKNVRQNTILSFLKSLRSVGCDMTDRELVCDCFQRIILDRHAKVNSNNDNDRILIEECSQEIFENLLIQDKFPVSNNTSNHDTEVDLSVL